MSGTKPIMVAAKLTIAESPNSKEELQVKLPEIYPKLYLSEIEVEELRVDQIENAKIIGLILPQYQDPFMNFDELEKLAVQLLGARKLRQSEKVLKRMLAEDQNCIAAHFYLAVVYGRMGKDECALYHGRRTLRLNPKEPNACLNLGLIYKWMNNYRRAKFYFRKELSRDSNNPETLFNLGRLYFDNHRWRDAAICLQRCFDIRYDYEMEDTVDKLAKCYFKLGEVKPYIDLFSACIILRPEAAWAAFNLGCAFFKNKDYSSAILYLEKAKQLGKDKAAFWLTRAQIAQVADKN